MDNKEEILREELKEVLSLPKIDYVRVLKLSTQLAEFDQNHIRFSVDAGLIDKLGNELVARQETAVSELVKNGYDADATDVKLTFENTEKIGGTLIIEDNGSGMSAEQLRDGFMRISSTEKIQNPVSVKYHRRRAGKKGIGRFSVQRLGHNLTIRTYVANFQNGYQLDIDWDAYSSNVDLGFVSNKIKQIPARGFSGTVLVIKNLRDRWSEAAISRIYQYISDIMLPQKHNYDEESLDPGMNVYFYQNNDSVRKEILDQKLDIFQHALALIEGKVDSNYNGTFAIHSNKLKFDYSSEIGLDVDMPNMPFKNIRNVKYRVYYFIYDSKLIPRGQMSIIKKYSLKNSGIKLYRNGFRVLPYGEWGDDWLSLDKSTRRRSILPTHTNQNFFGYVEISDESGDFEETSSREGLLNNEAFVELQNFIYRSLVSAVIKIAEQRNLKIVSGQKQQDDGQWEEINVRVKNIAFTISELDKDFESGQETIEAKAKRRKKIKKLKEEFDEVKKLQKIAQAKSLREKSMLRILGSVGLTVGQFVHEIKNHFTNIESDLSSLMEAQLDNEAKNRISLLNKNFTSLKTYISYFDHVISANVVRTLRPLEMREVVKPFLDSINADMERQGYQTPKMIFNGYNLYTKPMHPSEWSSILFNFYTNSKKAIKRAKTKGAICIECGESADNMIYLEFSDNGVGIPKEIENRIFEEFYTTTASDTLDKLDFSSEVTGTGLGLSIVRDIVSSYKGRVFVVSAKNNYSTCIRVEIPKASAKDLENIYC